MKKFTMNAVKKVQAVQFDDKNNRPKMVKLCEMYNDEIEVVPSDLMSKPKNAFFAVNTASVGSKARWSRIEVGDWIVETEGFYAVVPNGLFNVFFMENKD